MTNAKQTKTINPNGQRGKGDVDEEGGLSRAEPRRANMSTLLLAKVARVNLLMQ
jgi:hypothetical protein